MTGADVDKQVIKASCRKARAAWKQKAKELRALKPRKKVRRVPTIKKSRYRKAILGSFGNKSLIAERLGCSVAAVYKALAREGWEDIKALLEIELERVADVAEDTILTAMKQRMDMATASRTAQWLLSRARHRNRKMTDESKVIHEGGDKPIQVSSAIPVDALDLPLEVRKQILEAVERKAQEAQDTDQEGKD